MSLPVKKLWEFPNDMNILSISPGPFITQGLPESFNVNANTTLNLSCVGEKPPGALMPLFFLWAVDSRTIDETDPGITNTFMNNGTELLSEFIIDSVSPADSGNYSCTVHNRRPVFGDNGQRDSTIVTVFCELDLLS